MGRTISVEILALGLFWLAGVSLILYDIAMSGDATIQHFAGLVGCVFMLFVLYANSLSSTELASDRDRFKLK